MRIENGVLLFDHLVVRSCTVVGESHPIRANIKSISKGDASVVDGLREIESMGKVAAASLIKMLA